MGDPVGSVYFIPTKSYQFKLSIKDKDYSQDLYQVRLATSIASAYQIIVMTIFVDPEEVILEKLYGQDPIKLSIILIGQDEGSKEQVDFDLMCIRTSLKMQMRPTSIMADNNNVKDRVPLSLITVCRDPFKTMTKLVNQVYHAQTLDQVISDLVSNTSATLDYESEGQNTNTHKQILVPPTTLYDAIKYLDDYFGLFDGVGAAFCHYDNTLYIRNLTKTMKKNQAFTVYQLSSSDEGNTEIIEKSTDGKNFYTYSPISTGYTGNSLFAKLSKNIKYMVRPDATLTGTIELDLEDICKNNSLPSQSQQIYIDSNMADRTRYYIDTINEPDSEYLPLSKFGKMMSSVSSVSIDIEKNLPILNLINVGESVKLNIKTEEYVELSGKYILKSSDLTFSRAVEWQTTAKINLIRTHNLDS